MDSAEDEQFWASVRASFIRTWIHGFGSLLGWPESRTLSWATKWRDEFEAKDDGRIFFHVDAAEWMVFELIPQSLRRRLAKDEPGLPHIADLSCRIGNAIRGAIPHKDVDEYSDDDWQLAKVRVQTLLHEFGEALPEDAR